MLNDAFEALKKHDWGTDLGLLAPIEAAVTAAHGNAAAREDLEKLLLAALASDRSLDAKDFICRMLTQIGGPTSASPLGNLLANEQQAHMARYALERIPVPEAAQALRDALPKLSGKLKIGVISSLGNRRDAAAVPALSALLKDEDAAVARAAALALGSIGTAEAARALQEFMPAADQTKGAVVDAQFACAEALLADKKYQAALGIYQSLAGDAQSRLVRLAATRGMLNCAAKTA
jgi:HEAT repeat protein